MQRGCTLSCKQAYTWSERQRSHRQLVPSYFKAMQSFLERGGCTGWVTHICLVQAARCFPEVQFRVYRVEASYAAIRETDLYNHFFFVPLSSPLF